MRVPYISKGDATEAKENDRAAAAVTGMSQHGVPDVALPRSLGAEGNEVPDAVCRWACMISHHQEPAMFMARALKELPLAHSAGILCRAMTWPQPPCWDAFGVLAGGLLDSVSSCVTPAADCGVGVHCLAGSH